MDICNGDIENDDSGSGMPQGSGSGIPDDADDASMELFISPLVPPDVELEEEEEVASGSFSYASL